MAEYIEREALKALVKKYFKIAIDANMNSLDTVDTVYAICRLIDSAEKADIAPVGHGRWIWYAEDVYICTCCGEKSHVKEVMERPAWDWCPNCGARMDGGADNGE